MLEESVLTFDKNTYSYIDKYKPEIVVCIRDYEAVLSLSGNGEIGNKPVSS